MGLMWDVCGFVFEFWGVWCVGVFWFCVVWFCLFYIFFIFDIVVCLSLIKFVGFKFFVDFMYF